MLNLLVTLQQARACGRKSANIRAGFLCHINTSFTDSFVFLHKVV